MKTLFLALMAAVLLAGPAAAQPDKGRPQRPAMGPGGPGGEGVSDELKEKMEALRKAERDAIKPLQRQLRDSVAKLSDLLEDEAGDKELQAAMDKVEKLHKAIQDQREKSQAEMKALLPLKQRAQMMIRMAQGMERMQGGMQPRMGGQGMMQGRMGQNRMGGMRPGMRGGPGMGPDEDEGPDDERP